MFANAAPARIGDTIGGGSRNSEACGLESFLTWPHFAEYHAFPAIRYGAWAPGMALILVSHARSVLVFWQFCI